MKTLEIFPPPNTVQQVSKYFVDLGESGRWQYYTIEAALYCFILFFVLYSNLQNVSNPQLLRRSLIKRVLLSDFTFLAFIIAFILMSRIPLAVVGIQNPDEPFWVAGAKAFLYDPRPWTGVDTGTGGPIVPIALLGLKIIGLPIDQGSLKIMSGTVMALNVGLLFLSLTKVIGSALSRLVVLPLVVAISIMTSSDLIAYNSEHPVIFLLSLSLLFLSRLYVSGPGKFLINIIFLGLFLGLVPFAKLQGVPVAFFTGLSACMLVFKTQSLKHLLVLVISAVTPTLLTLLALWSYGGFMDFWTSYILSNFSYASNVVASGFIPRISMLIDILFSPQELHLFFYYSLTLIFMGFLLILPLVRRIPKEDLVRFVFSSLLLSISTYSVVAPGRPFVHYILFLLIPLTIQTGSTLQIAFNLLPSYFNRRYFQIVTAIFILAGSLFYFSSAFTYQPKYLKEANKYYDGFLPQGEVGAVLDHYLSSDAIRIAVWEYEPELFESYDFISGTRYAATSLQGGPLDAYYLGSYIKDLRKNKPVLFVESFYRTPNGFEKTAELKKYIYENYSYDAEIGGNNIYVKKDRLSAKKPWVAKRKKLEHWIDNFHGRLKVLKRNGSFMQFSGWTVVGEDLTNQKVMLALISKSDTILVNSYQTSNKELVDFSKKKEYLLSGYLGFIPIKEIPPNDYRLGLLVENKDKVAFKELNRTFNPDSLK